MKRRFVILVDWNPQIAGGEMETFGTWTTEAAADVQRERWERRALALADGYAEATPVFYTIEIQPKSGRFLRRLRSWWDGERL